MDLARIKKLTNRIRKQNVGRRPVPQKMHEAIKRATLLMLIQWRDGSAQESKQVFLARLSKPGYEPTLLELYVLREMMGVNDD